ncbi:unnamed protein product [Rotaria magnacalcarata]
MSLMQEIETNSMETRQLHSSQKEAIKKIAEFSGESNEIDIDEWLYDLNNLFSLMRLKDETRILETMGKLAGPALRWYQENLRSFINWNDAEKALRDRFKEFTSDSQLLQEFVHIHQEENQSVTSFYEHVIRKYRKARQCITEQQVITVLQTGVKNSLKEYLIRNEKDITKPDEWLQYARQEEYIQKRIQQQQTDKLLKNGIIEHSTSPWSSLVVLVKKKDGTTRIDDIYDQLTKATHFTQFDFKSGYFQVPLDKADRPKTAFSTRDGHFQFKVLPQGLTNGPPTFQRIVNQILGLNRWKHVLAYIDDIIIYSKHFSEHIRNIEEVCALLHQANFKLNVDKCEIARTEILFFGHVIKAGTIKPDPDNIRDLTETREPTSAEEPFRFVKAAEYYRKFIPKFSTIAAPLHKYSPTTLNQQKSNKKQKLELSNEAREAFHKIKNILTTDLILGLPDDALPFKLQTDACVNGIGAALLPVTPDGDRPLAYMSKKLTKTQTNWPTIEQECFAIVQAVEKWDKYLRGCEFTLETDHEPLVNFSNKEQLNKRCNRWRLRLAEYRIHAKHIQGKKNNMADYLSRSPESKFAQTDLSLPSSKNLIPLKLTTTITRVHAKLQQQVTATPSNTTTDDKTNELIPQGKAAIDEESISDPLGENPNKIIPFDMDDLRKCQEEDKIVHDIKKNILSKKNYFIENGILFRKQQLPLSSVPFVPAGRIRADILKIYHDTPSNGAHFGRDKTTRKIQERYYWPTMITDIKNHLDSCLPCAQNNYRRQKLPGK